MNKIEAVILDSREPSWVQNLNFGVPTTVMMMESGDAQVMCSDGVMLLIERKTPEDFLNSLRDERLLPQIARMSDIRLDDQLAGYMGTWPYLVITGEMRIGPNGKVVTSDRGVTGWDWNAIQGALVTIQEMGVFVMFCGETEYQDTIARLAARDRKPIKLLPPKPPQILGAGAAFLAGLPGIGTERVMDLMQWGGNQVGLILTAITDPEIQTPIGPATRKKIRALLGLTDKVIMNVSVNSKDAEILVLETR